MAGKDWALLGALSLLWGGSFFFVEVALEGLAPLTIVWCRVALAALLLAGVLRLRGLGVPRGATVWVALFGMGFLNNVVPFTLFALAQGQITGALAAILNATTPLFTVIAAHLLTADERITPAKLLGLFLGFSGVVLMLWSATATGELWAKAACLLAAVSYALAAIWGRRFRRLGVAPLGTAFGQVAASALMLAPVWLLVDRPWTMEAPELRVVGAVVGIAALSTALAYVIYFRLLASAGATNLALVTFLIPVSATFLGVLLLGERLLVPHLAGFGLVTLGLLAINGRVPRWR